MNNAPSDLDSVILTEIAGSTRRCTLPDLEKRLLRRFRIGRQQIRRAVRHLLETQKLQYTYTFGTSFLEVPVNHPLFIPPRIWITPPGMTPHLEKGQIAVFLQTGAAFGMGDHPSTRLALHALQWVVKTLRANSTAVLGSVLDVGTGSGVLLIAALKLGFHNGTGIDTDPCARVEAQENLRFNRLENHARIHGRSLGFVREKVAPVLANLRLPTILELLPEMDRRIQPGGMVVLSRIHPAEEPAIAERSARRYWAPLWRGSEKGWSAVVFQKGITMADGGNSESV